MQLLNTCVLPKDLSEGGLIENIGVHGNLIMTLSGYIPRVTCYPEAPLVAPDSCFALLQDMPARNKTFVFAKKYYARSVTLPKTIVGRK